LQLGKTLLIVVAEGLEGQTFLKEGRKANPSSGNRFMIKESPVPAGFA